MAQQAQHEVVVADASIEGGPKVSPREDVPALRIPVGETVTVAVDYTLVEASREKEAYAFTLRCEHGLLRTPGDPVVHEPASVQWEDRRGRRDARTGRLHRTIAFPEPGAYAIGWEAEAEYTRLPWGEHETTSRRRKSVGGRVQVHVEQA